MGQPQMMPTPEEMLAWIDRDCGRQLVRSLNRWYTREAYGMPVKRHPNLSAAVVFAMTNEKMKEAK